MTIRLRDISAGGREFGALLRLGLPGRRRTLALLGALAVLAALAEGSGLLLLAALIERLDSDSIPGLALETVLVIYLAVTVIAVLAVHARTVLTARARIRCVEHLRQRLFDALLEMAWPRLRDVDGAEATQMMTGETARAGQGLDFLIQAAALTTHIAVLAAMTASLSPPLAAVVLGLGLAGTLVALYFDCNLRRLGDGLLDASRRLQVALADALQGRRLIKAAGLEGERQRRFAADSAAVAASQIRQQQWMATRRAGIELTIAAATALGLGLAVRGFGLSLATALVFTVAAARLGQSMLRIRDAWAVVMMSLPAVRAIAALLARAEAAAEPPPAAALDLPRDEIRLVDVSVDFSDGRRPALGGITAAIPVGRTTAVIGPSGAGKSSFADLAMGLGVPTAGRVLFDGRPLDAAGRRAWRRHVGYVPQDAFLFHDTIRANLLAEADDATLWAALEQAAIADTVRTLPEGLDTVVGERGDRLSGGERQRLVLARALMRRPALLVLDEPTSALDPETEQRIAATLQALHGRLTILLVAHRPSLWALADRVIRLDGGRVDSIVDRPRQADPG